MKQPNQNKEYRPRFRFDRPNHKFSMIEVLIVLLTGLVPTAIAVPLSGSATLKDIRWEFLERGA